MTGEAGAPFEVHWTAPARRALRRLPEKVGTSAVEFIYGPLTGDPSRVGRPLRFELQGRYSAHRGDYRVVYRIDHPRRRVFILAIGHRADIYRRSRRAEVVSVRRMRAPITRPFTIWRGMISM